MARRMLDDRSGETLAVAMVALGLSDEAITRVFMFRDPLIGHSTQKLFALVDLSRRISPAAARFIVSAIAGHEQRSAEAAHRPVADPAQRARDAAAAAAAAAPAAAPARRSAQG
jgi:hypothetical protein